MKKLTEKQCRESPVHTDDKVEFNTVDFVEVEVVSLWPRTHWRQSRPRQAVEFKLLPICCKNRQQSRPYRQQSTLLPVSRTVVSLLQWKLARDIMMALAIKRVHDLPPHLSYVSTLVMFLGRLVCREEKEPKKICK